MPFNPAPESPVSGRSLPLREYFTHHERSTENELGGSTNDRTARCDPQTNIPSLHLERVPLQEAWERLKLWPWVLSASPFWCRKEAMESVTPLPRLEASGSELSDWLGNFEDVGSLTGELRLRWRAITWWADMFDCPKGSCGGYPVVLQGFKVMLADGSREHSAAKAYCAAGTDVRMADHMPKMRVASQNFCETRCMGRA
ncbi:hypothetical protein DB88DRAFT_475760 [Papiliotrema laurentii]|uniref:Uncharacterized protein n=1 Tax=Papiliotrema laurentii TaxID=5418 RepID=A0AAD9CUA0_PAPLA|nr:hypothetical protein DB88DRAFT_475760 [Papiliotrema laurentii]